MKMDSIGSLWRSAWKMYTDRFALATQIIVPAVVLIGLGNVLKALGVLPFAVAGSVVLAAGALVSIVASAALVNVFHRGTSFEESYRAAGRLFWRLIWMTILMAVAELGGAIMLVIPGIWLVVGFIFASYVVILEDTYGLAALVKSRAYVRGYWWAIFGRLVLLIISYLVIYIVVGIPFAAIGGAVGNAIAATIITLFFIPFAIAYYYAMYRNLVTLKPAVQQSTSQEGKKFIVVAQVVGVIVAILIAIGIVYISSICSPQVGCPNGIPGFGIPPPSDGHRLGGIGGYNSVQ